MNILNTSANGRVLYAIAFNKRTPRGWVPDTVYLHAEDQGDAAVKFFRVRWGKRGSVNVVGIAPVVGFKVLDEHGESLSV